MLLKRGGDARPTTIARKSAVRIQVHSVRPRVLSTLEPFVFSICPHLVVCRLEILVKLVDRHADLNTMPRSRMLGRENSLPVTARDTLQIAFALRHVVRV